MHPPAETVRWLALASLAFGRKVLAQLKRKSGFGAFLVHLYKRQGELLLSNWSSEFQFLFTFMSHCVKI